MLGIAEPKIFVVTALFIAFAVVASGCLGGQQVSLTPPVATFVGHLRGGPSEGEDPIMCDWLENEGQARLVLYPPGWDVLYEPTRLVDPAGMVVAREGDLVKVSGTLDPTGQSLCFPGSSKVGPMIGADRVEVLTPTESDGSAHHQGATSALIE